MYVYVHACICMCMVCAYICTHCVFVHVRVLQCALQQLKTLILGNLVCFSSNLDNSLGENHSLLQVDVIFH